MGLPTAGRRRSPSSAHRTAGQSLYISICLSVEWVYFYSVQDSLWKGAGSKIAGKGDLIYKFFRQGCRCGYVAGVAVK